MLKKVGRLSCFFVNYSKDGGWKAEGNSTTTHNPIILLRYPPPLPIIFSNISLFL